MRLPILCVESNWDGKRASKRSVSYLLQLISAEYGVPTVHLFCNTQEEFLHNIQDFNYGFRRGILYFAFHGKPFHIKLGNQSYISLDELAVHMGRRFKGWYMHFGSCSTLNVGKEMVTTFKHLVGASMISGYNSSVFWTESAAMDILLFSVIQEVVYPGNIRKRVATKYSQLSRLTGLEIF